MLIFAEHHDFAVRGIEFGEGAADPERIFRVARDGCGSAGFGRAGESRAENKFSAVRAEYPEGDSVEVSAEEGAGFVARGSAEKSDERFLRQLFGAGGIGDATAKKTEDRLFVAMEKTGEGVFGTVAEGEDELFVGGVVGDLHG